MTPQLLIPAAVALIIVGCSAPPQTRTVKKRAAAPKPSQTVTFTQNHAPGQHSPVDDYVTSVSLARQQALAHYHVAMRRAEKHLKAKKYNAAMDAISIALAILDSKRSVLQSSEYTHLRSRATRLRTRTHSSLESQRVRQLSSAAQSADLDARRTANPQDKQRSIRIQRLLQTASIQRRKLDFVGAETTLHTLLAIEPHNTAGKAMLEMVVEIRIARHHDRMLSTRARHSAYQQLGNESATIPHAGPIHYPSDWAHTSHIRNR